MFTEIGKSECIEEQVVHVERSETLFSVTENDARVKIVALGIGGMGQNAMENLGLVNVEGLEIYSVNTDMQALSKCVGSQAVQIGKQRTCGRGAGGDSEIGRLSAEDDIETLRDIVSGAELVFIAAGMGGGTGTGAAPVIGRVCREMGIMTIGVVTTPMRYEGPRRMEKATSGLSAMRRAADSLMVIENEKLSTLMNVEDISIINAFKRADGVLVDALSSIARMINLHGYINLDLADLNNVLKRQSEDKCDDIIIGVGEARGEDRASRAAQKALDNQLLANSDIRGAVSLLVNVAGSEDMGLQEALSAVKIIEEKAGEMDREIFMGVVTDNNLGDMLCVTVIANGLGALKKPVEERQPLMNDVTDRNPIRNQKADLIHDDMVQYGWKENVATETIEEVQFLSDKKETGKMSADRVFEIKAPSDETLVPVQRERVETSIHPDTSLERTNVTEKTVQNGRDKFVQVERQINFENEDELGKSPLIDKDIWKTPAGMRRELLFKRQEKVNEKIVKIDKKAGEGWQNRVLDDDRQVSLLDQSFQAACS